MARLEPTRLWWSADALADARLPGMPGSKRGINAIADQAGWRSQAGCARRKAGRGGGWEYHWTVLPMAAQSALLKQSDEAEPDHIPAAEAWHQYEALPQNAKDKAALRLRVLHRMKQVYAAGETSVAAVNVAAAEAGISDRSVYGWMKLVEGVDESDWLAYLPPRNKLAVRAPRKKDDVREFMDFLKSTYLRIAPQTFRQCHRKAVKYAKENGFSTLAERTAQRRLEAEVPYVTRVLKTEGVEGLERCFPTQIRDRSQLGAMGGVNADCHKIDVFVEWPDGTINRPQIIAFQDLFSNKFLSWRVDHTPNSVMVMAAFGDMINKWGIPKHCLFDNGREFANKWLTAGTKTRFRFKIREDEPLGVLPLLGIKVHWAKPASGQSKPIERAFRDLANDIARDPRFSGAYVGNRPDAKPENYGSRAIPAEQFLRVFEEGMIDHNARQGRLGVTAEGRSYDETFAESYGKVAVRKATEEQKRLYLMGQHICKLNSKNGSIMFQRNVYHSDWMSQHPARAVVARFDPENLHDGLSVFDADGSYLGFAECQQKVGFFDIAGGAKQERRKARIKKAERKLADLHVEYSVADVAAKYDDMAAPVPDDVFAKVVQPDFRAKQPALPHQKPTYQAPENHEVDREREALIVQMSDRKKPAETAEKPSDRFWRARALLDASEAGEPIGQEEVRWLNGYIQTAEYEGLSDMFETFGKDGVG